MCKMNAKKARNDSAGKTGASCHMGQVVTWGKLSQWLIKKKNLLERSINHILDVSVNANSFPVQCSMIASVALTRIRVLHFLPRKKILLA